MATIRQRLMKLLRMPQTRPHAKAPRSAAPRDDTRSSDDAQPTAAARLLEGDGDTKTEQGDAAAEPRATTARIDDEAVVLRERAQTLRDAGEGPDAAAPVRPAPRERPPVRRVDLALQGGGSHGAFTWGVLDRLLEDESIEISAISGTSAGALNAGVLATGFASGGRDGARKALADFWADVSHEGHIFSPFSRKAGATTSNGFEFDKLPAYQWVSSYFRSFSPYEFNPLNLNPLRDAARRHVDETALRNAGIPLFITATNVNTGQARVFTGKELSIDALLASACLPMIFQAVEIDGQAYWDGGYTGNPALYPLIYQTEALDILLVRINPLLREGTPTKSVDIIDRVAEITFNASLIAEMRAIAFVSRLVREGRLDAKIYKDLRLHMVADDAGLGSLGAHTKFNTERAFLEGLFELGRAAASTWLVKHGADLGVRSSFDVEKTFLAKQQRTRRTTPAEGPGAGA